MREFKNFEGVNLPVIKNRSSFDYEELKADPQFSLDIIDMMVELVVKELGSATETGEP